MTTPDTRDVETRLAALRQWFRDRGSALIAFSGGVDSTFLLKVAVEELGERVLALTLLSPMYPAHERDDARRLAEAIGARYRCLEVDEVDQPAFRENPPERCYLCKKALFGRLCDLAREEGLAVVCDGTNADDLHVYRPGRQAAQELGVASPLAELGFSKAAIRVASRLLGLPTWSKPTYACLATRFPYGEPITREGLAAVGRAEALLRQWLPEPMRLRCHGTVARLEVAPAAFNVVMAHAAEIVAAVKDSGFAYVTLDLQGFRSGSLDEVLGHRADSARPGE